MPFPIGWTVPQSPQITEPSGGAERAFRCADRVCWSFIALSPIRSGAAGRVAHLVVLLRLGGSRARRSDATILRVHIRRAIARESRRPREDRTVGTGSVVEELLRGIRRELADTKKQNKASLPMPARWQPVAR